MNIGRLVGQHCMLDAQPPHSKGSSHSLKPELDGYLMESLHLSPSPQRFPPTLFPHPSPPPFPPPRPSDPPRLPFNPELVAAPHKVRAGQVPLKNPPLQNSEFKADVMLPEWSLRGSRRCLGRLQHLLYDLPSVAGQCFTGKLA